MSWLGVRRQHGALRTGLSAWRRHRRAVAKGPDAQAQRHAGAVWPLSSSSPQSFNPGALLCGHPQDMRPVLHARALWGCGLGQDSGFRGLGTWCRPRLAALSGAVAAGPH